MALRYHPSEAYSVEPDRIQTLALAVEQSALVSTARPRLVDPDPSAPLKVCPNSFLSAPVTNMGDVVYHVATKQQY